MSKVRNEKIRRWRSVRDWALVVALVLLTTILAILQYRWLGRVSAGERERMRAGLEASLRHLRQEFNDAITSACAALMPAPAQIDEANVEQSYIERYTLWKESGGRTGLFRRIALATPRDGDLDLRLLDPEAAVFRPSAWPVEWSRAREALTTRSSRRGGGPFGSVFGNVIDLPRFRPLLPEPGQPPRMQEANWLLAEIDEEYVKSALLPELARKFLGSGGRLEYAVEVTTREDQPRVIYRSGTEPVAPFADASVGLFEPQYDRLLRRGGMFRGREKGGKGPPPAPPGGGPQPDRGRWLLSVRHASGSLDAVVQRSRWLNLAAATAILSLVLASAIAMVQFSRRAERLAHAQMEFVAGISHELRTPLTVIRTAAHNIAGGLVKNPDQMKRYGKLIAGEADRLTGIVEQVLRFAGAEAGRTINKPEPVAAANLIDNALAAVSGTIENSRCAVERNVPDTLPPLLADPLALGHAMQNLIANAAKYGSDGGWIGVSAAADAAGEFIEFVVEDRGAGIPADELARIFDPFYRGKRAIEDQIHGTGLGLNLVKRIVEAHKGSIAVASQPGKGTRFTVRIPTVPEEQRDEFADLVGRG